MAGVDVALDKDAVLVPGDLELFLELDDILLVLDDQFVEMSDFLFAVVCLILTGAFFKESLASEVV